VPTLALVFASLSCPSYSRRCVLYHIKLFTRPRFSNVCRCLHPQISGFVLRVMRLQCPDRSAADKIPLSGPMVILVSQIASSNHQELCNSPLMAWSRHAVKYQPRLPPVSIHQFVFMILGQMDSHTWYPTWVQHFQPIGRDLQAIRQRGSGRMNNERNERGVWLIVWEERWKGEE
jgi:hypothetical protein